MRAPDVVVLLEKYIQPTANAAPATPAAHDHDDHAGHDHSH
jgi:hypothetical protein